jgi:hypothetical protein
MLIAAGVAVVLLLGFGLLWGVRPHVEVTDDRLMPGCTGREIVPAEWRDPVRGVSFQVRRIVWERDGGVCCYQLGGCQVWLDPEDWHVAHEPFAHAVGGRTVLSNLRASCPLCNLRVGAR